MTCRRVRKLLSRYVDGELPSEMAEQVTGHTRSCASCKQELRVFMHLAARVMGAAPEIRASKGFTDRLVQEIRGRQLPPPGRARRPFPAWKRGLVGGIAGVLLVGLLAGGIWWLRVSSKGRSPERMVSTDPALRPPPMGPEKEVSESTKKEPEGRTVEESESLELPAPGLGPGSGTPVPETETQGRAPPATEPETRPRILPPPALRGPSRWAKAVGPGLERRGPGEARMTPVPAGNPVPIHDLLRTPAGVIEEVLLSGGTRVKLNENTSLRLRSWGLVLYEGEVWIQTPPPKNSLCVQTPTGVRVAVVGTEFLVTFSKVTTQTTVTVLKGTLRVRRDQNEVVAHASEECIAGPVGPPSPPQVVEAAPRAAWATGRGNEAPSPWWVDFTVTASTPTGVFSRSEQPCTFTLRLRNQGEERQLDIRYWLTELHGRVVQEGQEGAVVRARANWEKPLSIQIAQEGLYTLMLTVRSGEKTLEQSLDFAVEE